MEDILKALNVDKLNEDQQKEIKEKLEGIVDVKSRERADSLLGEEKTGLVEDYEKKFDEYKTDITSKFSNFVDTVLDEELVIPDKVTDFARKGELYSDLIEQFKIRLGLDEGILDDEVKNLLSEAKEEILSLRKEIDNLTSENLTLKEDAKKFAANIYLREKCDGLTPDQTKKVLAILGDIYNKTEIDEKFKIVSDTIIHLKEQDEEKNKCKCPDCGKTITTDKECEDVSCPDCDVPMVPAKEEKKEKEEKNGKGKSEVKEEGTHVQEDDSPFGKMKEKWVNVLKEGKI